MMTVTNRIGEQSRYINVGTDRNNPITRRGVVMHVDRANRGMYYAGDRIEGQANRARMMRIGFDDVDQSRDVINRMRTFQLIPGAHNRATQYSLKR